MRLLRVSQEQLALQANVRSTTISNYINNISDPGLKEIAAICQFFGISMDAFVFENFETGKVITEEYVQNFKQKGKGNGKLIGKETGKYVTNYSHDNPALSTVNEGEATLLWAVLNTLKQMDGKIDTVQAGVEDLKKKKP
jgi:DNA-binding XRE family transcriptional regulator